MKRWRWTGAILIVIGALLLLPQCASAPQKSRNVQAQSTVQNERRNLSTEDWRRQLRDALEQRIRERMAGGQATDGADQPGSRALALISDIHRRIQEQFRRSVEDAFGMPGVLEEETVQLEAVDKEGNVREVPYTVKTRPLRTLTDPSVAAPTRNFLREDKTLGALYEDIPDPIAPAETEAFVRLYTGEAAEAIAMETRLIVTLKGGEWVEPAGAKRVANVVAVRGLDLDQGLHNNDNKTYDDTMYVVIEAPEQAAEVYEYRMTTESSSTRKGVGRLAAKQVYYVRGLHRGKDPAFRLEGNRAEGTRVGREGTYDIVGANIHSAYTRRPIDSATPLAPNISLGCQVIAASKTDFERDFIARLDKQGIKTFPYTIVSDKELALLDDELHAQGKESILARALPRRPAETPS